MKISYIIYQAWHYGMLFLLYNWHFQDNDFATSEIIGLPFLFFVFFVGLFYFYLKVIFKNGKIDNGLIFLILFFELFIFVVDEIFMFYFGWTLDSAPG